MDGSRLVDWIEGRRHGRAFPLDARRDRRGPARVRSSSRSSCATTCLLVSEHHRGGSLSPDLGARAQRSDARGAVGDETYVAELKQRVEAERSTAHVQKRLYPTIPDGMPYVCFYPMSKRRAVGQNWYALSLDQRSNLMRTHGTTGRRYAGKVLQIITGAIGLDAWEWGVTLFAKDPLDFKRLVTDMRFDEVSAKYADFGDFYVGTLVPDGNLEGLLETIAG